MSAHLFINQGLYKSRGETSYSGPDLASFFNANNEAALKDFERDNCEGQLTEMECLESSMDSGKSPGADGLPAEFYKIFWKDVAATLIKSQSFAYEMGKLSITQRRGIIKLIPKKDGESYLIKNWRPLTLLNCEYKLASKTIANRLRPFLPNLINSDQPGYIKDRFIGENIRLIESVICHAITSFS